MIIDAAKFTSPALTYIVKDAAATLIWTDAAVTSTENLATCGSFKWMVTKTDGITEIDSNIFGLDLETKAKSLNVYTTDL